MLSMNNDLLTLENKNSGIRAFTAKRVVVEKIQIKCEKIGGYHRERRVLVQVQVNYFTVISKVEKQHSFLLNGLHAKEEML